MPHSPICFREQLCQVEDATVTNVNDRDRAGRTPLHYAAGDDPLGPDYTAALTDPALAEANFRKANEYRIANTTRLLSEGADVNG